MAIAKGKQLRGSNRSRSAVSLSLLISHFLVGVCGIYIGITMGSYTCPVVSSADENVIANASGKADAELERQLQNTREVEKQLLKKIHLLTSEKEQAKASAPITEAARIGFPKTVNKVIVDYATVPRDDINKILEIGVPMDPTKTGSEEVVVLYTDTKSMPSGKHDSMVGLDASTALENCNTVKVILQQPATKHQQCFAIVPQWESYHVHKFMRVPMPGSRVDSKSPLKYVSRTQADDGKVAKVPSWQRDTKPSFDGLVDYLSHLDASLENLQPILQDAMHNARNAEGVSEVMKKSKIMVVLVCNKGQSHLFQNFVCNARAKGLDLSRIIMFATDQYTVDLCKSLDIEVFYDEHLFGSMPESAAKRYGDGIFSQMMMAKVYCVHLVLRLGYDVLFQDVDVVWQRNPLEYLETKEKKEWDMLFQDDGSRQTRYQPYSPNTGFYFVRNNNLTQYFFNCLLRKGDLISRGKSHQAALASQIAEFVSWQGLRVKVWPKFGNTLFPGGVEYHNGKDYMKQFIDGRIKPFIFHMSWTLNKDNKKIFFEQMAEWYTKDDKSGCAGLDCCVAEPIITCHYKDKPSKIPCKDSPSIDKKGRSFWK